MHVKRLREAGLVNSVRQGNRMEITINEPSSDQLAVRLTALLAT
jgi:DNA-binding transcriptional ArsR family regulator